MENVAEGIEKNAMRVVALPVDPVKLAEVIAREVCRQHGATYKGYRFRNKTGTLEVSALGVWPDNPLGSALIVGEVPVGTKAWQEANEAP